MKFSKCAVEDCIYKYRAGRRYCDNHRLRIRKYGTLDPGQLKRARNGNRDKHPLYRTYIGMKSRCLSKTNPKYYNYGGRGITVCNEWLGIQGFDNFLEDMGVKPDGYTLDRIDNDGNYEPSNCRWADWMTQNNNRRKRNYRKTID